MKPKKNTFSTSNEISELWKGESLELLKSLHILTRDGKLNADSRRKLKQVYHLAQFIEPLLNTLYQRHTSPHLVDMGAGKSYLGFILYDLFLRKQKTGEITSIEYQESLVEHSKQLAIQSSFQRMHFIASSIEKAELATPAHAVLALHACDTATDDAIRFALKHQAEFIVLVPCCQAEVARELDQIKHASSPWPGLETFWKFPIHRREWGSFLTNLIRVLYLESQGYEVRVTELIGWEHSMKNELILAEKKNNPSVHLKKEQAQSQLDTLLKAIPLHLKLFTKA